MNDIAFDYLTCSRQLEQLHPADFAVMTRKRYQVPNGYHAPQAWVYGVLGAMASLRDLPKEIDVKQMSGIHRAALDVYLSSLLAHNYAYPVFFLSPGLLKAAQLTELPKQMDWRELRLPYDAGCLVLPRDQFCFSTPNDCRFIFWARTKPESKIRVTDRKQEIKTIPLDYNDFYFWSIIHPPTAEPFLTIKRLDSLKTLDESVNEQPMTETFSSRMDVTEQMNQGLCRMAHICCNALLLCESRPSLRSGGERLSTIKKSSREIWSPIILGKDFHLAEPVRLTLRDNTTTSHASPRMHWRRGHYRNQPFGSGHGLRRLIWIEPMLVNAEMAFALA